MIPGYNVVYCTSVNSLCYIIEYLFIYIDGIFIFHDISYKHKILRRIHHSQHETPTFHIACVQS